MSFRFARIFQHVWEEEETAGDLSAVQLWAPGPHRLRPPGAEVHRAAAAMAEPPGGHGQPTQAHGGPFLHHPHPAGTNEGTKWSQQAQELQTELHHHVIRFIAIIIL